MLETFVPKRHEKLVELSGFRVEIDPERERARLPHPPATPREPDPRSPVACRARSGSGPSSVTIPIPPH